MVGVRRFGLLHLLRSYKKAGRNGQTGMMPGLEGLITDLVTGNPPCLTLIHNNL
jgi:hypothetical protein